MKTPSLRKESETGKEREIEDRRKKMIRLGRRRKILSISPSRSDRTPTRLWYVETTKWCNCDYWL